MTFTFAPKFAGSELRTSHSDLTSEPLCGCFSQRHHAITLAFAQAHRETMRGCIRVVEIQFVNHSMADAGLYLRSREDEV